MVFINEPYDPAVSVSITRYIAPEILSSFLEYGDDRRPGLGQNSIKVAYFVHQSPSTSYTNTPYTSSQPLMSSQQNTNAIVQQVSDE